MPEASEAHSWEVWKVNMTGASLNAIVVQVLPDLTKFAGLTTFDKVLLSEGKAPWPSQFSCSRASGR